MDGNGRWATRQRSVRACVGTKPASKLSGASLKRRHSKGVGTLTLYAFSSDNWRRPRAEVAALMGLLRGYLARRLQAWSATVFVSA